MSNLKSTRAPATYEADMAPIFAHKLRNFESFETFGSKKSALSSAAFAISFAASTSFTDDESQHCRNVTSESST